MQNGRFKKNVNHKYKKNLHVHYQTLLERSLQCFDNDIQYI
jgi:hypothetical protein